MLGISCEASHTKHPIRDIYEVYIPKEVKRSTANKREHSHARGEEKKK
jgi:hypothetical protein